MTPEIGILFFNKPLKFVYPNIEELSLTSGNILKFKGKKKELYNLMNDQYEKVKSYISNNKINLKRMSDLARVVSFYNQI